jgi:hypothetical protein
MTEPWVGTGVRILGCFEPVVYYSLGEKRTSVIQLHLRSCVVFPRLASQRPPRAAGAGKSVVRTQDREKLLAQARLMCPPDEDAEAAEAPPAFDLESAKKAARF